MNKNEAKALAKECDMDFARSIVKCWNENYMKKWGISLDEENVYELLKKVARWIKEQTWA